MLIRVTTFPGSAKEEVIKLREDSFRVFVREEAREGMATEATRRALAKHLKVSLTGLRLVRGGKERGKIFEIQDTNKG